MDNVIKFFTFKIRGKSFTPIVKFCGTHLVVLHYNEVCKDYPILKTKTNSKIVRDTMKEDIYITLHRQGVL